MRLLEQSRPIERIALGQEIGFTIKASASAFKILSSGLYRDKILAIIRELSCNAYDAHVAAGCPDRPFQMHLPNLLEPSFTVRDWGLGLSPEAIASVYTTYFESDKTASNDYIGAFGLGAKSPFAYVDSFTIGSWQNGVCRRYAAFLAEHGAPVISLLSEVASNEATGVEVSLPVQQTADFAEFASKARTVLRYFRVPPDIVGSGGSLFHLHQPEIILQGDGWRVTQRPDDGGLRTAQAIMGNVAYPIVASAIEGLTTLARRIYDLGIDIAFPIGSLDVTAGRENLSYDKVTLAALQHRAEAIAAEAPARFQQQFDACPSRYAAHRLYGRLFYCNIAAKLLGPAPLPMRFRDRVIDHLAMVIDLSNHPAVVISGYDNAKSKYRKREYRHNMGRDVVYVPAEDKVLVLRDDLNHRDALRSRVAYQRKCRPEQILLLLQGPAEAQAPILDQLDGWTIQPTSTLAKPPPVTRPPSCRVWRLTSRAFGAYTTKLDSACWIGVPVDPAKGGFYVLKQADRVVHRQQNMRQFPRIMQAAVSLGLFEPSTEIHGFTVKLRQCLVDKPAAGTGVWIDLLTHLHDATLARLQGPTLDAALLAQLQALALETAYRTLAASRSVWFKLGRALPAAHPLAVFTRTWEQGRTHASTTHSTVETLRLLCEQLHLTLPPNITALVDQWGCFRRTYPLLSVLEPDSPYSRPLVEDAAHLAGYVQWVDAGARTPPV